MSDSSLLPLQRTQQAAGRTEQRKLNKIFSLCNIALWRPNVEPKIPRPHWELISVFLLLSELYQKLLSSQYVFTIPNLWWCVSLRVYRNWRKRKESEVTQLCLTLCNPMDCSLPSSSVHGFFFSGKNTRVGYHFLLQMIFLTQGSNLGLLHCRQMFCHLSHQGSL